MPYEPTTDWEGYFAAALSPGASFAGGLAAIGGIAGALGAGGPQAMTAFANKLADTRNMEVSQAWAQFQKEEERRFQAAQADADRAHDKAMQAQGHTNAMALQRSKFSAVDHQESLTANAELIASMNATGGPRGETARLAMASLDEETRNSLGENPSVSDIATKVMGYGGTAVANRINQVGGMQVGAGIQNAVTESLNVWKGDPEATSEEHVAFVQRGHAAKERMGRLKSELATAVGIAGTAHNKAIGDPTRLIKLQEAQADVRRIQTQMAEMLTGEYSDHLVGDGEVGGTLGETHMDMASQARLLVNSIGNDISGEMHQLGVEFSWGQKPIHEHPALQPGSYAGRNEWSNASGSVDRSPHGIRFVEVQKVLKQMRKQPEFAADPKYAAAFKALDWVNTDATDRDVDYLALGSGALDTARNFISSGALTGPLADEAMRSIDTLMSQDIGELSMELKQYGERRDAGRELVSLLENSLPASVIGRLPDSIVKELSGLFIEEHPSTKVISLDSDRLFAPDSKAVELLAPSFMAPSGTDPDESLWYSIQLIDSAPMPKGFRDELFKLVKEEYAGVGTYGGDPDIVVNGDILELKTVRRPPAIAPMPEGDPEENANNFIDYLLAGGKGTPVQAAIDPRFPAAFGDTATASTLIAPYLKSRKFFEEALGTTITQQEAITHAGRSKGSSIVSYTDDELRAILLSREPAAALDAIITFGGVAAEGISPEAKLAYEYLSTGPLREGSSWNPLNWWGPEGVDPETVAQLTTGGGIPLTQPTVAQRVSPPLHHTPTLSEIEQQHQDLVESKDWYTLASQSETLLGHQADWDDDPTNVDLGLISATRLDAVLEKVEGWLGELTIERLAAGNVVAQDLPGRALAALFLGEPGQESVLTPGVLKGAEGATTSYSDRADTFFQNFVKSDIMEQFAGGIPTSADTGVLDVANSYSEVFDNLEKIARQLLRPITWRATPGGQGTEALKQAGSNRAAKELLFILERWEHLSMSDRLPEITRESLGSRLASHLPDNWDDIQDPNDPEQRIAKAGAVTLLDLRYNPLRQN